MNFTTLDKIVTNLELIALLHIKLCFFKVAKLDAPIRPLFANPVTIVNLIVYLSCVDGWHTITKVTTNDCYQQWSNLSSMILIWWLII